MEYVLPPSPRLGILRAGLWLVALIGGATLGYLDGAVWPIERLYGGWVTSGSAEWGMEGWTYDHRDKSVSGMVVHKDGDRISSLDGSKVSLVLMDEVTYDFERTEVYADTAITEDGHRAEWHVSDYRVPPGKRFRGVALDGSFRDATGKVVELGGEMAYGGPSWDENERLSNSCESLASRGDAAVPDAIALLDSDDPIERGAAAAALGRIGASRPSLAVPALLTRLRVERYTLVQDSIVYALGDMGAAAEAAVPAVLDLARSSATRDQIRRAALISLGRIGPPAARAIPDLIRIVQSEQSLYRLLATSSLGQMGPSAEVARPALEALRTRTTDFNTQAAIRETLARIGGADSAEHPAPK